MGFSSSISPWVAFSCVESDQRRPAPAYIGLWLDDTLMYEEYNYGGIVEPNGFWGIASYSQSAFDNLSYTPM